MELSLTLPNQQPRNTAWEMAETVGAELLLYELLAFLPHSTLNDFLVDFASHLEAGDYNDILP